MPPARNADRPVRPSQNSTEKKRSKPIEEMKRSAENESQNNYCEHAAGDPDLTDSNRLSNRQLLNARTRLGGNAHVANIVYVTASESNTFMDLKLRLGNMVVERILQPNLNASTFAKTP